jgi:hypothetical protein
MMRVLVKTKWVLPVLLIGLALLAVKLPTSTLGQALADGPPTRDEAQAQIEDAQPLAYPGLAELVAEEPDLPDATAQLDEGTHGTY